MKKIIYTIGILMFLSAPLRPWTSLAADSDTPTDPSTCIPTEDVTCAEAIEQAYALKDSANQNLDWGQSFGETDPAKVGQNLYLMVYKKASSDTLADAINATAAQYGLPPERMSLILAGNITPILERSPLMTYDQASNIYNQMLATYNDKKDSANVQAKIKAKVEPNEMFSDGDLDNSGFDLIQDLNNIDTILFKKADTVTFGQPYDSSSEDTGTTSSPSTPSGSGNNTKVPVDINGVSGTGNSKDGSNTPAKPTPDTNPFQQADENKDSVFSGGINPNQCFATQNLDKALDNFAQAAVTNSKLKSTFDPSKDLAKIDSKKNNNSKPSNDTGLNVPVPNATQPAVTPDIPEAPAGDYSEPSLCDDVICLTIDFVEKPATPAFSKTDNCIQCHVQYINDSMQKTISHSLIPGKASGNLGESGLCKNAAGTALGLVGMNVSINVVPIVTPVKNDLMSVGNITDEWDKYASKYGGWNYDEKKQRDLKAKATGKPADPSPLQSDISRMLQVEIMNAGDNTTQAEILKKVGTSYNALKAQQTQEQLVAEVAQDAYGEVDTLKALDEQMQQMNNFFTGFKNVITTLNDDVPGLSATKACVKLQNKQACT